MERKTETENAKNNTRNEVAEERGIAWMMGRLCRSWLSFGNAAIHTWRFGTIKLKTKENINPLQARSNWNRKENQTDINLPSRCYRRSWVTTTLSQLAFLQNLRQSWDHLYGLLDLKQSINQSINPELKKARPEFSMGKIPKMVQDSIQATKKM